MVMDNSVAEASMNYNEHKKLILDTANEIACRVFLVFLWFIE